MKLFSLLTWIFPVHIYQTNVAAAVVGGAVIGGVASNMAAGTAADAQENASNQANATQRYQYDQTRSDQGPYREAGYNALAQLSSGIQPGGQFMRRFSAADLAADPVYNSGLQFGLSEGEKALNHQAAASGSLLFGATLKALTRYGNDYASTKAGDAYNRYNTYQTNQYNRLAGVAGTGQQANSLVASAGQNMANNVSANQIGVGNARASSYIAGANGLTNAIGTGINAYQQNQLMNSLFPSNSMAGYSSAGGGYYPYGGSNLDYGNMS